MHSGRGHSTVVRLTAADASHAVVLSRPHTYGYAASLRPRPARSANRHTRTNLWPRPLAAPHGLPSRLPLGSGDRRLPDRGSGARRRPGRERLGSLRCNTRQGPQRRHGGHRLRLLPPIPRGRCAHASARPRGVSLLGGVAARLSPRPRAAQSGRPRLLRPLGGRASRERHRAFRDALPLGHPPSARGRGRLDESRNGGGLRRVRRGCGRSSRRSCSVLDHAQRALGRRLARPCERRACAGADERSRCRCGRPSPAALARARCRGDPQSRAGCESGNRSPHHAGLSGEPVLPRTRPRPGRSTASTTAGSSIPSFAARTRATCSNGTRSSPRSCARATWRRTEGYPSSGTDGA